MPPWIWPFTSIGFTMRPTSSTTVWRTIAHGAGLRVDLDLAHLAAVGERDRGRRERRRLAEAGLHARRKLPRLVGGARDARRSVTPLSVPATVNRPSRSATSSRRRLEQLRGDAAAALDDLLGRAHAPRSRRRVSAPEPPLPRPAPSASLSPQNTWMRSGGTPRPLAHDLREGRLVALAHRRRAREQRRPSRRG